MVVVKIELWPFGDEGKARSLGTMEITNDGKGTAGAGNYNARIFQWGKARRVWKTGRVEGFPRKRLGPWDLLYRALRPIVGQRNPGTPPPSPDMERLLVERDELREAAGWFVSLASDVLRDDGSLDHASIAYLRGEAQAILAGEARSSLSEACRVE